MEKLKYFSLVLMVALCAGFTSCSDDDDDEPAGGGDAGGIVGMWQGVTSENYYKENGKIIEQGIAEDASDIKYDIKADGTAIMFEYGDGEWYESPACSWVYSDGVFTVSYPWGQSQSAKVLELSDATMVLEYHETGYYDGKTYEDYNKLTLRRI